MKLVDSSSYNADIQVENGLIEVIPPGFQGPVVFNVEPNFSLILNSSNTKIAPAVSLRDLINLPDGVYRIKYSVKPNTQLFVEYSLLRNCLLMQKFYTSVCELFNDRSKIARKEFESRRAQLLWIKELIDASKYKVDEQADEYGGADMYNEANRLIDKYNAIAHPC